MDGPEDVNGQRAASARKGAPGGLQVDVWLRDTLASTYNPVLSEPLPESWMRLIRNAAPADTDA